MVENIFSTVLHMVENLVQHYFSSIQKISHFLSTSWVTSDNFDGIDSCSFRGHLLFLLESFGIFSFHVLKMFHSMSKFEFFLFSPDSLSSVLFSTVFLSIFPSIFLNPFLFSSPFTMPTVYCDSLYFVFHLFWLSFHILFNFHPFLMFCGLSFQSPFNLLVFIPV